MKNFLSVAFILVTMIFIGCGGETADKYAPESEKVDAILLADSFWVVDAENMPYLTDAITRKDTEYLNQLMLEGKVFRVDKDTKVTRFGVAANENNVLIKFKEGRYTNKAGCTFKTKVIDEEEFPEYLEEQNKEAKMLIQNYLVMSKNYVEVVGAGKEAAKRILELCDIEDKKLIEKKKDTHISPVTKECIEEARGVVFCRFYVISCYLESIEFSQKIEKENPSSKEISYYRYRQEQAEKTMIEYQEKAEQARQEFKNKYGY